MMNTSVALAPKNSFLLLWCRFGEDFMTFSKHLIFVLSVLLAIVSQFSLVVAGEIPGYVGQQSFRLQDDPQLNDMTRRTDDLKVEVARIDQGAQQIAQQAQSVERDRDNQLGRMDAVQKDIDNAKANKVALQAKLIELNKAPDVNKDQITQAQNEINGADQIILDLSKRYGQLKSNLDQST